MRILVIINGCMVYDEEVSSYGSGKALAALANRYQIELLQRCGVEASLAIEGVKSAMNYDWFQPVAEPWDETHFKDINF